MAEPLPNNFVTGELYYKGADKTMSESAIPINWVIVDENADYLIFKGEQIIREFVSLVVMDLTDIIRCII